MNTEELQKEIDDLKSKLASCANLESRLNEIESLLRQHKHKGNDMTMRLDQFTELPLNASAFMSDISYCSGTPTGTPKIGSIVYDKTNNKLYFYNSAWKSVTLT